MTFVLCTRPEYPEYRQRGTLVVCLALAKLSHLWQDISFDPDVSGWRGADLARQEEILEDLKSGR